MAKRDEAALKLLRWELEGHGSVVLEAMLRHPDKSLADAVDLIEKEIPALSPREPQRDPPTELPMPSAPRGRSSSELDALGQEFQTFRHLLRPREAKEFEETEHKAAAMRQALDLATAEMSARLGSRARTGTRGTPPADGAGPGPADGPAVEPAAVGGPA